MQRIKKYIYITPTLTVLLLLMASIVIKTGYYTTPLTVRTVNLTVYTVKILLLTVRRSGPARIGNVRDLFTTHVGRAREVKLLHSKSIERPIKRLHLLIRDIFIQRVVSILYTIDSGWAQP